MENGFKKIIRLAIAALLLDLSTLPDAVAAGIFIDCQYEVRVDSSGGGIQSERSMANVKVKGLAKGKYFAQYRSANNVWIQSRPKFTNGRQKLEFEYDSNPEDVALEGKTQIPADFNASGSAIAVIRKAKRNGQVAYTRSSIPCPTERIVVDNNGVGIDGGGVDDGGGDDNGGDDDNNNRRNRNRGRQ